ncbi:MAG: carbohydrate ABC transporter permease [Treponema sp.]|nr:carbohydrate ABC transporter permease [Treponema sp.]
MVFKAAHLGRNERNKIALTFFFVLAAAVIVFPLLWALSTSFKTYPEVLEKPYDLVPRHIQLDNYISVFTIVPFTRYFINSVIVSSAVILGTLVFSSLAAYAFSRLQFKGRTLLFLLYIATLMVPRQVVLVPNFMIMKNLGLIDNIWSLILTGMFTAYGTFFLRQFFLTIPIDLEEAAIIDGLGYFKRLSLIIIPLAKPALVTLLIITLLNTWNDFLFPLVFINTDIKRTLPVGLSLLRGDFDTQWNIVMAATLLSILPLVVVFVFAQKFFIEGIALSGIKG